MNYHEEMILI